nr:hypothetical protein [Tanacetum cinerariifolium]
MEAIEKRYGGNKESKKVQRTLLKQQYENFSASRSSNTNQNSQNIAFVSSNNTSNTNEVDTAVSGVSTAHTQGTTVNSTSVDKLSDVVICAFLTSQPNSPQLAKEDLEQIDHDDLEEMDLHWEMAMLTIRARRFIERTNMNLDMNGQRIGFDKSKVECFNYHKKGHFARECRALKNQGNRGREYGRKTVLVESPIKNTLIAQDGIGGYDWSYQAKEEIPTNYAFIKLISLGSSSSSESENRSDKEYHAVPPSLTGNYIPPKRDLRLIDEHFKSVSVDVISNIEPSDVKSLKTINVNHKGVFSIEEPKPVMKNNFSPLIIEDWHSDDESEEISPTIKEISAILLIFKLVMVDLFPLEMEKVEFLLKFCEDKGIKREFSEARTPQQNRVAERRNRTLIEAARTMALVTKPHNKTPYELIRGRPPLIDFMKPFGCPVTILNTKDNLDKFEEKADEGYFVGYSVVSKAIRVFNKRTRIVEETLNIKFQENTPNVKGNGPDWHFDIDSLIISMNYVSVVAGNKTNGIAGSKEKLVASQDDKKKELKQEYILIPICITGLLISQGTKDSAVDARKNASEVDESEASDNGGKNDQVPRNEVEILFQQERKTNNINSTNSVNTISSPINTVGSLFVNAALQTPINAVGPSASTNAFEEHSFE